MARRSAPLTLFAVALSGLCLVQVALGPQELFLTGAAARRDVLGATLAGTVAVAGMAPALADWQGEPVRIIQLYGPQILGLKDAVNSGDFDTISKKFTKFDIFSRGVYKNDAAKQSGAVAIVDKIAEALDGKNAGEVKAQYEEFLKFTQLPELFKGPPGSNYHLITPTASMATR